MDDQTIGGWSQGDLRRFIVNSVLSDPGSLPKPKPDDPTTHLPTNQTDGDVPVWDKASQRWLPSTQHGIPFSGLATWTWASMGWSGNYAAAPDKWLRNFWNGSNAKDLHSADYPSWIIDNNSAMFQFPVAGKYLVSLHNTFPHQQTGEYHMQIFDNNTGSPMIGMDGLRGYVTAGNDVFGPYSGAAAVCLVTIDSTAQSHNFHPVGFYNGGSSLAVYISAVRIPL